METGDGIMNFLEMDKRLTTTYRCVNKLLEEDGDLCWPEKGQCDRAVGKDGGTV